jgi:DNA invertase Pin-like site-specific DNA recombinase
MRTATAIEDWGTYTRISEDPDDKRLGVNTQNEDTADEVAKLGGTLRKTYVENDTSAWKKRKVKVKDPTGREYDGYRVIRPLWHEALHDLRTGVIRGLMVYNLDRLARDPRDLEDAIEAVQHYGATILSATNSDIDLSTESGIMSARLHVLMANKASADTARRVRRAHLRAAREGKAVGGRRPFGYNDDKVTLRESEAALIREAAADVLAGTKLATIAQRWNDAGVKTVMGTTWTGGQVLQLLRSPRIAGWRIHRPTGSKWTAVPSVALDKHGEPVRGEWTPILDDATHRQLVALLTSRPEKRKRLPRRNARQYLVTGLLRCAECHSVMYGNRVSDTSHYYRCDTKGCSNSASGRGVDDWVAQCVVARSELVEPNASPAQQPSSDRLRELSRHIDGVGEMIEDIMAAYRAREIPARVAFANVTELEDSRDAALAERDVLEAELAAGAPEVVDTASWAAMDVDHRRAAAERVLQAVYVRRATKRGNVFDRSRLDPVWR